MVVFDEGLDLEQIDNSEDVDGDRPRTPPGAGRKLGIVA